MEVTFLMWSSKEAYSNRKGFTLLEMIMYIALTSMLLTSICSILIFSNKAADKSDSIDNALFNGRYAIDYIKGEIINSDKIISSSNFCVLDEELPNNLGFVSMNERIVYDDKSRINKIIYNFRTYFIEDGNLVRLAYSCDDNPVYNYYLLSGNNQIAFGIVDSNCNLDTENNLITLSFDLESAGEPLLLETTINLRCPVE